MTILVLHQAIPPTFYNKIVPMISLMGFSNHDEFMLCFPLCAFPCCFKVKFQWCLAISWFFSLCWYPNNC